MKDFNQMVDNSTNVNQSPKTYYFNYEQRKKHIIEFVYAVAETEDDIEATVELALDIDRCLYEALYGPDRVKL